MTSSIPGRTSAAPTKQVLVVLTIAVLAGHWLALGGRVSLWPGHWFKTRSTMDALPEPQAIDLPAAGNTPTLPEPEKAPDPVSTSTVRWIAPPAPQSPPKPKPKPVVRKAPPAPPPPTLSSAIEALGAPSIEPLSVEEMMEDIVVSAVPEPAPAPPAEASEPVVVAPLPPVAMITKAPTEAPGAPVATDPTMIQGNLPTSATLSYDVKGKAKGQDYVAAGSLVWSQSGNSYEAKLEVSAMLIGSIQTTSTGLITAQGLAPQSYVDRRKVFFSTREKTATFDREAGVIRYSAKTPDVAIQPGAQDQLSVTLQLAGLLNAREKLVEGDVISVQVSSNTDAEIWQFQIGAVETLRLPAGEVSARHLVRLPRKSNDKKVEVWLAPNMGRLPVRTRLTEANGDFVDQLLDDLPEVSPREQASPAITSPRSEP
jgi:hypothetical protein